MRFITSFILTMALLLPGVAMALPEAGAPVPEFSAIDSHGNTVTPGDQHGKIVVLEWKNHRCPFVKKHYGAGNMQALQQEMTGQDVVWWSVLSSAPGKQGHVSAEEANTIAVEEGSHASAILLDEAGVIGKLYGAKTTPHMFVIAADGTLAYSGAIDSDSSPSADAIAGATNYVRAAVTSLQAGEAVEVAATAPYGCSVKY